MEAGTEAGINFAVSSAHADAIAVSLFDAGDTEIARLRLPERTGDVFHGHVGGLGPGTRYGLRAFGPWAPEQGHRFDPGKLLVDPYAIALDRPFTLHPGLFGSGSSTEADTAALMPKAIAGAPQPVPPGNRPFNWERQVIYELHVRGFTMLHPDIPPHLRGRFAGLGHPAAIAHLRRLGITTVELMPSAAWTDERHLPPLGLSNYWGYNPVAMLAPDPRLAPGGWAEVREAAAALQAAGIAVVLDVVLNHTGESDHLGPTLSLRGLDNATYYRLQPEDLSRYVDDAGCGNILALDRPAVMALALAALRAWVDFSGVDGFRLDLAVTLGRRDAGFDPAAPLLAAMQQDPVLASRVIIAEPWDLGPGGYRLGAFPGGWGEWNDRSRDTIRRFWRGDPGMLADMATRFAGSADIFAARHRPLSRGINYVTAHDGFTLADLVAYARKHNQANGEDNRDGTTDNLSWNNGIEGATADEAILAARRRDVRGLLATLLLARGTPMLSMGDEAGRTQQGNNNAYAQDNRISWLDWANLDQALIDYTARLIRARLGSPVLANERRLTGEPDGDGTVPDVAWRLPDGRPLAAEDWHAADRATLVMVLHAAGQRVVVVLHAGAAPIDVTLPEPFAGRGWRRLIDSAAEPLMDGTGAGETQGGQQPFGEMRAEETRARQTHDGETDASRTHAGETHAGDRGTSQAGTGHAAAGDTGAGPNLAGSAFGEADCDIVTIRGRSVVLFSEAPVTVARPWRGGADAALHELALAAGIAPVWWDVEGRQNQVSVATKRALLAAMRQPTASAADIRDGIARLQARTAAALPPTLLAHGAGPVTIPVRRQGHGAWLTLLREDGGISRVAIPRHEPSMQLPALPVGRHRLLVDDRPEAVCHLAVAPRHCYMPDALAAGQRRFGIAAHLYTLRRQGDQGLGDFTTLAALSVQAARHGAAIVGLNPLHALFPGDRDRASPYHPADRRFLDPIYVDVPEARGFEDAHPNTGIPGAGMPGAGMPGAGMVNYKAVWQAKQAALRARFDRGGGSDPGFAAFLEAGGPALRQFATFEAIAATLGSTGWRDWPPGLRHPLHPGVTEFAAAHEDSIRFTCFMQYLADTQLALAAATAREAGLALGFYRDLAVGAAPDGAEAWGRQDTLMTEVSVGAPPDPFSAQGQVWSLPPPDPLAMAQEGYAGFSALLAANMRHAGALRIDHVMALRRLYLVPDGASAADGAYVTYPFEDLLGQVALESHRARCLVVGEALGTVPEGMPETLAQADVLSYSVLWFERDGATIRSPANWRTLAAACVSTHDLPTLVGWWSGADIAERAALGLMDPASERVAWAERAREKKSLLTLLQAEGLLPDEAGWDGETDSGGTGWADTGLRGALAPAAIVAVHALIARTPALLTLVQADDLAGEAVSVNLPGTDRERPNWRRRLTPDVASLFDQPIGRAILAASVRR